jgi:hypothetical protein
LIITLKHSNHWTKITTKNNHECIIHRTLGSVWCDVMVVSTCIIAMLYYGSDGMGWEDGWYWHCVVGKWSIIRPFRLAMVAFTHHWVGIIHLFPFPFSFIVNTYLNDHYHFYRIMYCWFRCFRSFYRLSPVFGSSLSPFPSNDVLVILFSFSSL